MKLSKKRKEELKADVSVVQRLYKAAVEQFGKDKVEKDLSRLWDLRCIWGMQNKIPFKGGTVHKNIGELFYVARELCGYGVKK